MATGDVLEPERPNFEPNQRFDQPDADAVSRQARDRAQALDRALLSAPRATAANPVGFIFAGGSVTPNPTMVNDGLVRLNAELFSALDADGNAVVKPSGTTLSVAIPAGGAAYQLYAYEREVKNLQQVRQFLTSAMPYTEISQNMFTKLRSQVGLHVRAGNASTVIPDDVINGVTQPLVFLGIAVNTLGAVTFDATAQVNRLSSVRVVPTLPVNASSAGSMSTVTDQLAALLYLLSRERWLGSINMPFGMPSVANNFGAYSEPPKGIDYGVRKVPGYVTIGDGTTVYGDFDLSSYANGSLCLQAAMNALPTFGGVIALRENVRVTLAANVSVPAGKNVTILGDYGQRVQLLASTFKFVFAGPAGDTLRFQGLRVGYAGTVVEAGNHAFQAEDCSFLSTAATAVAVITAGAGTTAFAGLRLTRCLFAGVATADSATTVAFVDSADKPVSDVIVRDCTFRLITKTQRMVSFSDVREDVRFSGCQFRFDDDISPAQTGAALFLASTANTDRIWGRVIENCSFVGCQTQGATAALHGIVSGALQDLKVIGCQFNRTANAIDVVNPNGTGGWLVDDCDFRDTAIVITGAAHDWRGSRFSNCRGVLTDFRATNRTLQDFSIDNCTFDRSFSGGIIIWLNVAQTLAQVRLKNCRVYQDDDMSLSGAVALHTTTGSSGIMTGVAVEGCEFYGGGSSNTDNVITGLSLKTYAFSDVSVRSCKFLDMQNVTYTGTANDSGQGGFRVLEFRAFVGDKLVLQDNTFHSIGNNFVLGMGGALALGSCISFKPHLDGVDTSSWRGVLVDGNMLGDEDSIAAPLTARGARVSLGSFTFSRNNSRYQYPSGVTFAVNGDLGLDLQNLAAEAIIIENNYFRAVNNLGAAAAHDIIALAYNLVALELQKLSICNNHFDLSPNPDGYDTAAGRGVANGFQLVRALAFVGNTGYYLDRIRTSGFNGTISSSVPTPPATGGNLWTLNAGLRSEP